MKRITCYLDFISPYAYLAFEHLPRALEGLSYEVDYVPVLFAGMLQHHGQLGPAEIAPKRAWTYRQVLWTARQQGIPMDLPAAHPFNPLGLLRLALACPGEQAQAGERAGRVNRHVCEAVFRHVWRGGADAADAARLQALTEALKPARDPGSEAVKSQLKANSAEAIARGVFGVPAFVVDDRCFWGFDALPMLRAWIAGDAWFDGPDWNAPDRLPVGISRPGAKT
ncbi:MAG: 2-hydroxychromene-2-carboxylate isomerase [Ramlibacter sp.]